MPKLLIATTVPETLKAFLLPYADFFRKKGWTVDAMSKGASSSADISGRFDNFIDVAWSRNPLAPANLKETVKIREAVRRGGYDIAHVHTPVAAFAARFAMRDLRAETGLKVVYTAHGFHFHRGGKPARNFAFKTLERLAGRWTDRLIVINKEDFEQAKKNRIVAETAIKYMPGIGLDFSKYRDAESNPEDVAGVRGELGLSDEDVLYTMIAAFNPGKRHRDAIEALALIKNPEIRVAFAGPGPLAEEMKLLARELGVAKRTYFLGFREDIPRLIRASRATILTSEREGLPRSLMESACIGTPIIGADARGIRDVVLPDRGVLYPVGDVFALRDAMLRLADDPLPPVKPDPAWRIENLISMHEELYSELLD
ncbi:MAG: glycosyltransferase [Synergistaceae bacterium]|jgi:glycosyltransferase involved in cell wall biosynthesis|nr:glycosyltransferase [Synergistaceae bacterium]